ncbi:siderophore-interacting protein [Azospirillum soli]|uniref:siderophore-interacting protein n=1 Tax=Azospirillum soli TaxID=1304799 RepID=UPI001AE3185A|nr:siderophore-interacting protein [Azospirillum soli]MBP2314831.1 NADPH-dependent ferric siderophore reductase [Azospirillum soli]
MKDCLAHARVALSNPEEVIARVCGHMVEHGGRAEERDGAHILHIHDAQARFTRDGDATLIEVTTKDLEGLYHMRSIIASHVLEFAEGPVPEIAWAGDGGDILRPPNFQILQVVGVRDVTPHMRRLTLSGADVARFAPTSALHLNILVQHPAASEPQWPTVGRNGLIQWADPEHRPLFRKYTVRSLDLAAGTLDIDFVLHADAGPGSTFAERAKPGDRVGIVGPGGGGLVEADWYLFAGDETALPAIARMLEHLPEGARGRAVIEVADAGDIQPLTVKADIEVEWLLRNGAPAGTTTLLADAVRGIAFPDDGSRVYAWAACEYQAFRAIRSCLREERRLQAHEHLAVAYWRRGEEGD